MTPERLAELFHTTYERLAPSFGYETRKASAVPWDDVPDQNKRLMIAVADEVLQALFGGRPSPLSDADVRAEATWCVCGHGRAAHRGTVGEGDPPTYCRAPECACRAWAAAA